MENRSTSSYFNSTDEASMRSKIALSGRVETTLEEIYRKHNLPPISDETRQRLSSIPEDLAFDKVMIVLNYSKPVFSIDGFIKHLVNQSSGVSPAQSPIPSASKSRKASQAAINHGKMDDLNAAEMIMVGIPLDEPHLKNHLSKLLKTENSDLKEGRLPVTESYYLMGTTGELKKDEVCVILESGKISGDVLVYRNPGNSKYAVFFPQKGPRSLGDEIAGGDCDGDMYFISRNPEVIHRIRTTSSYFNSTDEASMRSKITLSGRVETTLEEIYRKHNRPPISDETRQILSSIPEDLAFDKVMIVLNYSKHVFSIDGFIKYLVNQSSGVSPAQSPISSARESRKAFQEEMSEAPSPKSLKREGNERSLHTPHILALSELEFKKAFLLLSYIPGQILDQVITADEIRQWKDLPMVEYEAAVWDRLGRVYCSQTDRRVSVEWDSEKTHYYQCHVALDGSYTFKGPLLENTGTHLHKVLGDENVLTVKFEDIHQNFTTYRSDDYFTYKEIAKNGILVGLRRYQFFVFKDGGKEEKKKDYSTKGVKCYFIRTDSTASNDMGNPYIFAGKSIREARMHFMHVHTTLPSLAKYMARFSLILSKTKTLEVDMTEITFDPIDDIHCHDQDNNDVLDKNGEPCIHSDGTGYISEDLARMCPVNIFKGMCRRSANIQEACDQDPPLLIQCRMFYDGYAVKGTFLLNKKIPPRTVQPRRRSMIKVSKDPDYSNVNTFNTLEVVTTSNPPKRTRLSRNLVALLSYGGVPDEFFLKILRNTLEESKTMLFNNKSSALKAAINHGKMDDLNAAEMILVGIPLDEPHLKNHLSTLLKTENSDLKAGKLPVTESYYLMGTVDPTGELKEDEVCVILESGQISGDVLVYRNPGLHFGDIHVLKATYVKALEEYVGNSKYAVFFPQKGPRSVGNEMANGDFDGDTYFISRNPELLKHFKPSEPWVSLSPPSTSNTGRDPSHFSPEELEAELFEMFLKRRFHGSNVIGMAADSWLTIMDRFLILGDERAEEKAVMKQKMLELIDIYYDALDAPKKGDKVDLPYELRPDMFPHYMEREKQFKSTSILGLIYDAYISQTKKEPSPSSEITKLPCFEDESVSESHMEKYTCWYDKYKREMSQAMKPNKSESPDEVIQRYKQEFYGAAGFEDSKKSLEELYPQALALYNIVYDYAIQKDVGRCGFVWKVAGPVLCRFYQKKMQEKPTICSLSVLKELWG